MKKRALITGAAGFVGHHLVEHLLKNTDWELVLLDRLGYSSSGLDRLREIDVFKPNETRIKMFTADFTNPLIDGLAKEIGQVEYILHLGAESHVDNSILNPEPFVRSNVLGTMHLLNFARTQKDLEYFLYFSTDEVFGPAAPGVLYKEWDRYNSGNPYAAAKAGGEELALAFANTYRIPVIITHTMNIFGERQHPEKFIPKCMRKILAGEVIEIHSNRERTKAGSRFWIHARNVGAAVLFLLNRRLDLGPSNADKFNIVGEKEVDNLTMAQKIASVLGKDLKYELVDFHSSRPGHDLRYALSGEKMVGMGWKLPMDFDQSLEKTIRWSLVRPQWLNL